MFNEIADIEIVEITNHDLDAGYYIGFYEFFNEMKKFKPIYYDLVRYYCIEFILAAMIKDAILETPSKAINVYNRSIIDYFVIYDDNGKYFDFSNIGFGSSIPMSSIIPVAKEVYEKLFKIVGNERSKEIIEKLDNPQELVLIANSN
jgi:hypothetical protein